MVWHSACSPPILQLQSAVIKNSALEYLSLNIFIFSFKPLIKFTLNHFEFIGGHYKKPRHLLILQAILSFLSIHIISSISVTISSTYWFNNVFHIHYQHPGFLLYFVVLCLLLIKILYPTISDFSDPVQLFARHIISCFPTNLKKKKKICIL
jgi:hypothetical protein